MTGLPRWVGLPLAALMALSVAAYAPLRAIYGPFRWFAFGPIYGQTSRVLLYFVYFAWGIVAGMPSI